MKLNSIYCVEMWRKDKKTNHDTIIQSKPGEKECPGLKIHFKAHLNPDHKDARGNIICTNIYPNFKSLSLDLNNNESNDENNKEVVIKN